MDIFDIFVKTIGYKKESEFLIRHKRLRENYKNENKNDTNKI